MANTLKIKRSAVASKVPATTDLQLGELAINTYDGKLFLKKDNGTESIIEVGTGGSMVYPGAGIPNSTGTAWGTSYSTTGSGTVVALATTPTFVTNITTPLAIGGTTASSSLTLQSTSGVGTSDSILFKVGNNGAKTAMTIDTSGRVGIGITPSFLFNVYAASSAFTLFQGDAGTSVTVNRNSTDVNGPVLAVRKARGTTASPTAVASGDSLGGLAFQGYGGTTNRTLSSIGSAVDTYTSDTDISSYLTFNTSPSGSAAATERLRIGSAGQIGIAGANYGTAGQVLTSNGASAAPSWQTVSAGTSVTQSLSTSAPSSPSAGDLWWQTDTGTLKIYYNDGNSSQWVDASTGPAGAAAALTLGTVTTVNPNVSPSITNSGTASNAIYDFSLPRAASVTLGTTSTLSPGSSATLTNTGTNGDAILNFGIPRGSTVTVGTTTTVNPNVSPSVTDTDATNDVTLSFSLPRAPTISLGTTVVLNPNQNPSVASSTTNGDVTYTFSLPSASAVSVGTTTTGNAGTSASVTNTGTNGNTVLNFTIPRGDTGATGPMGPKSILLQYPTTGDTKIAMFYTTGSLTLSKIMAVLPGGASTPSLSYNIRYGSDISATGTAVTTSANTVTNTTTGTAVTSFTNGTISAGSFVWVEVTAVSGSVPALSLTLEF